MADLTAYVIDGHELRIRPAPVERDWMDATGDRFAYRCLPLNIANAHGWEIVSPSGFVAAWDGKPQTDAMVIVPDRGTTAPAISHFGSGILTFHVPALFQTEAGMDLFATGPINRPKDGIAALTGIIETDWSPYSFTMNWLFTRPGVVRFEAGEPFCHIFPVVRGMVAATTPELRKLSENPELEKDHKIWTDSRNDFNRDLSQPGSQAVQDKWQKAYFRGITPSGNKAPASHQSKIRACPFKPST